MWVGTCQLMTACGCERSRNTVISSNRSFFPPVCLWALLYSCSRLSRCAEPPKPAEDVVTLKRFVCCLDFQDKRKLQRQKYLQSEHSGGFCVEKSCARKAEHVKLFLIYYYHKQTFNWCEIRKADQPQFCCFDSLGVPLTQKVRRTKNSVVRATQRGEAAALDSGGLHQQ